MFRRDEQAWSPDLLAGLLRFQVTALGCRARLAIWSHIHHKRDVFVTSDENFHGTAKKLALIALGQTKSSIHMTRHLHRGGRGFVPRWPNWGIGSTGDASHDNAAVAPGVLANLGAP